MNYELFVLPTGSVQLACVRHAASVRSEPGSNSQYKLKTLTVTYFLVFKEQLCNPGVLAAKGLF